MTAFLPLAQVEWGTVPDWVAAFGTLAAFAVALRLLFKELEARREYEADRRRDQARLVAAWTFHPGEEEWFSIVVHNGSDQPIYEVKFTMVQPGSTYASDPIRSPLNGDVVHHELSLIPPQEKFHLPLPVFGHGPGPIGLSFQDALGRAWVRYPDGRLEASLKRAAP